MASARGSPRRAPPVASTTWTRRWARAGGGGLPHRGDHCRSKHCRSKHCGSSAVIEIKMPRLSDTMEEGAISTWRKHPGDTIAVGDVLVEIETDKAVMEYEAYQAGTLSKILVDEGQVVGIGAAIALIDDGTGPGASEQEPPLPATT